MKAPIFRTSSGSRLHAGLPLIVIWVAGSQACGGDVAVSGVTVDSAGVKVIVVPAPETAGRSWTNAPEPTVEIGLESGSEPYLLSAVRGALRREDSLIVVADGGARELRVYNTSGDHVSSTGREGEGPEEFENISFVAIVNGDSLLVYDDRLWRASLFDSSGDFLGSWTAVAEGAPPFPRGVGALANGGIVTWGSFGSDPQVEGPYTVPLTFGVILRGGLEYVTLDTIRSRERARVLRDGGRWASGYRAFGGTSDIAVSGSTVFVLNSVEDNSIRVYSSGGDLRHVLRFNVPRARVTRALAAAWSESFVASYSDGFAPVQDFWNSVFERTPPADSVPLFRSLETDRDGNICAERYPLSESADRVYWCVTPEGEFLRALRIDGGMARHGDPLREPRTEIGSESVLGVWVDERGVERVRSYPLVRDVG